MEWNLLTGFFREVLATSAISAAMLVGLGFLCRAQISHWLTRDLEAEKARHQRELEAYKTTLIAGAEKAKALQEVKKAAAIKIAELQFAAIDRYHRAFLSARYEIPSNARMPAAFKTADLWQKTQTLLRELRDAEHGWDIFLTAEECQVLLVYRDALVNRAMPNTAVGSPPLSDLDWTQLQHDLFTLTVGVEALLKAKLEAMQNQE